MLINNLLYEGLNLQNVLNTIIIMQATNLISLARPQLKYEKAENVSCISIVFYYSDVEAS